MRPRIRYIALLSDSPDDQARFYSRYLELQELGRSNEGDVSMTDGFFNITFLKRRPEIQDHRNEIGLHHIGLEVPSIAEVEEKYRALRPNMPILDEPGGLHFGERRIFDPEGTPISLSERPFGVDKIEEKLPRIRHIAYNALWPEGVHNFFVLMFGFRELEASFERRAQGRQLTQRVTRTPMAAILASVPAARSATQMPTRPARRSPRTSKRSSARISHSSSPCT